MKQMSQAMMRPDRRTTREIFIRTVVKAWDFWLSLILAAIFFFSYRPFYHSFNGTTTVLAAAAAYGVSIATGSIVAARWLSDRMKDDDYGRIIRTIDPEEVAAQLPYYVICFVGCGTSIWAIAGLAASPILKHLLSLIYFSILLFLVSWSIFGFFGLLVLSWRHQRRAVAVKSLKEQMDSSVDVGRHTELGNRDTDH